MPCTCITKLQKPIISNYHSNVYLYANPCQKENSFQSLNIKNKKKGSIQHKHQRGLKLEKKAIPALPPPKSESTPLQMYRLSLNKDSSSTRIRFDIAPPTVPYDPYHTST